ncbi:hypothetical protein J3458_009134 [Metarhizium acridum]|uniref:uncharacterized protein n=1 Tax=Metarhizium acridum TaxID=92637 RepID=UPI001C6C8761|nr:hypothetical protein J3458_009134 [Metarhizium acridum]
MDVERPPAASGEWIPSLYGVMLGHLQIWLCCEGTVDSQQETQPLRWATGTPKLMRQRAASHTFAPLLISWGYNTERVMQWKQQPLSRVRSGCTDRTGCATNPQR